MSKRAEFGTPLMRKVEARGWKYWIGVSTAAVLFWVGVLGIILLLDVITGGFGGPVMFEG